MKARQPRVSVLIPTTGRVELIRDAIASVLAQDMADFEIVVASLGNEAAMAALLASFGDERIRQVPVPLGTPGLTTWDRAATEARGSYFFWLDDDNYLLPGALALLLRCADTYGADLVAGGHFYYYDVKHPRPQLRGALGVVPFTGSCQTFSSQDAIAALFTLARIGPKHRIPRLHPSALLVSRTVVRKAQEHFGSVLFTDLPNTHSFQPIVLSQAAQCLSLDYPVVVVGRFGISMSQVWSTAARDRFRRDPFIRRFSPVIGYTRINGTMENYLRLKQEFPADFGAVPVNFSLFAQIYLQELRYLDMDAALVVPTWENLFAFIATLPEPDCRILRREAAMAAAKYPLVFMARRLRLHRLWRLLKAQVRTSTHTPREAFAAQKEFSIPLAPYREASTIGGAAQHAFSILAKEIAPDLVPTVDGAALLPE